MEFLFSKKPQLKLKLIIVTCLSLCLMFFDGTNSNNTVRLKGWLGNILSGVYYIVNTPYDFLNNVVLELSNRQQLLIEKTSLKTKIMEQNADLLLLSQLKVENQRLRMLLHSSLREDDYKKIAEVLSINNGNKRHQVVINKGSIDGVSVGQPVISENGIAGQVIRVSANQSTVLLITDKNSSVPAQSLRTDIRTTISGIGYNNELIIDYISNTADIKLGDVFVTSGLDQRYPEGYPIATVQEIKKDSNSNYLIVKATPLANLDRLRYLLLLWKDGKPVSK